MKVKPCADIHSIATTNKETIPDVGILMLDLICLDCNVAVDAMAAANSGTAVFSILCGVTPAPLVRHRGFEIPSTSCSCFSIKFKYKRGEDFV